MNDNPYAAPLAPIYAAKPVDTSREAIRRCVRRPALALMGLSLASMAVVFVAFNVALIRLDTAQINLSPFAVGVLILLAIAWLVCSLLMFIGAALMLSLHTLSYAKTAARLALVPFCPPLYPLILPTGLWVLRVLSRPEVQAAFLAKTVRKF
jgi:hypothetical protein